MDHPRTKSLISKAFSVAQEAALEAGHVLFSHLRSHFQISKKGRINLVTEMDLEAEKIIVDRIRRDFPDHEILAEEQGTQPGSDPYKWIIDPLDGTTNYAHGYRFFCVSIALEVEGQIVFGTVYDPVTEELFSAKRGEGASLNGQPIHVSNKEELINSLLCTGFSYDEEEIRRNLKLFDRVILRSRAVRRDGSAALDLCYIACGRFDGFWELSLHPWDRAAGQLIVEEASGQVTALNGSPCTIYDAEILASNGKIHASMVELLRS
ncbi:inositol monophosphatase [Acidobacteria bacterium AH-259-G07]|nr:inositol monophosphatase [Acidobacteria bacterium AH-259-G07]